MIRRGRSEGWLREPIQTLPTWAAFHGVKFDGVKVGPLPGFEARGSSIMSDQDLESSIAPSLIAVPKELIISLENITLTAKSDQSLRELLEAAGEFGRTTRGAVLLFLLMQSTVNCPDISGVGVRNPLTEYIKFLPDELLPTFWTEEEQELLEGTTLKAAVRAKLNSLLREFEEVRTATMLVPWCAKYWWDEDAGLITFDDWMRVDAMYRSRALEFPGVGDSMVPCIDMANHASGDATVALYETDSDGNAILILRSGRSLSKGGEVTITYGDEKGACENIFSYGFLEDGTTSAKVMFLDLDIPDDDPLKPAKIYVNNAAPGFRLFEKDGEVHWESEFVWLAVINEEDGIDFKIKQTIDGKRVIQATWKETEFSDTTVLQSHLKTDEAWKIFHLRAVCLLYDRVDSQANALLEPLDLEQFSTIREQPRRLAIELRGLELDLLLRARTTLEHERAALVNTEVVQRYLGLINDGHPNGSEDEQVDFT